MELNCRYATLNKTLRYIYASEIKHQIRSKKKSINFYRNFIFALLFSFGSIYMDI